MLGTMAISDPSFNVLNSLKRAALCDGLSQEDVQKLSQYVHPIVASPGEIICREGEHGNTMFLIARGRVRITTEANGEPSRVLEFLGRGGHFGEMAVLTDGKRTATVTAVTETQLLEVSQEDVQTLLLKIPGFAANLSRSLVGRLRAETARKRRRHRPDVIAVVTSTLRTQLVLDPLAKGLVGQGDRVVVLTDRQEGWPTDGRFLLERIPPVAPGQNWVGLIRQRIHQIVEHQNRVILEISQVQCAEHLPAILALCEEIIWLVEPRFWDSSRAHLRQTIECSSSLASRIHLGWVLKDSDWYPPQVSNDLQLASPDFKFYFSPNGEASSRNGRLAISRLVRFIRGTRIGVALGGGGARGMAHLGVLRALEREGISVDHVAGTSSGALLGLSYAGGWSPDDALSEFQRALTPRKIVRAIPGGYRLYMLAMFRLKAWNGMLRPFMKDAQLQQLPIPLSTVTVDLITGKQVVRDQGDAINAVLESINLPWASAPIMRDGMALVDGGVLNNFPGDVLQARGMDFVIGIDISTKLPKNFGKNSGMNGKKVKAPKLVETLLRVYDVQANGLTAFRSPALDFVIDVDTSEFDFSDFSRASELADVGDMAAQEIIPQLKQAIADFESAD